MKADKRIREGFILPDVLLSDHFRKDLPYPGRNGDFSLLLGYSGGADSSFLLHVLCDWAKENSAKLFAAHINHGIRGDEALRDREHCRTVCEALGVKLFILDADVPAIAKESGKSLEDAAREVRYDFFKKIMKENDIPFLATAHNAEDNLETMLFRLARGSGARGLCGIPPVRELGEGRYALRPMLGMRKADIVDICRENCIKYVYDSTNDDTDISRNNIRASVLPVLSEINPEVAGNALRTAAALRDDCEFLEDLAEEFVTKNGGDIGELAKLKRPVLVRVLSMLYAKHSNAMLEHTHIDALIKLIKEGEMHSSVSLPGKIKCVRESDTLVFLPDTRENSSLAPSFDKTLIHDGINVIGENYIILRESGFSTDPSHSTQQIQTCDGKIYNQFTKLTLLSDKISGELFARPRLPSDRIRSGGMSKDVRKLFSEHSIPLDVRPSYPIVCDGEGVVWVPKIAERDGCGKAKNKEAETVTLILYKKDT